MKGVVRKVSYVLCAIAACFVIAGGVKSAGWLDKKTDKPVEDTESAQVLVDNNL